MPLPQGGRSFWACTMEWVSIDPSTAAAGRAHDVLTSSAADKRTKRGERSNVAPLTLTKDNLSEVAVAACEQATKLITVVTDLVGRERRPPIVGVGLSKFCTALHVDCASGKACLLPGALAVLLADGELRSHIVPEYGLQFTLRPGEAGVETSRNVVHGNCAAPDGAEWNRRCLGLFEDWQAHCAKAK